MNPQDLLKQLMGNPGASAAAGGLLGGSLSGLLGSKKGRKSAKKLATYGGLAALGVMAYQAWQRSQGTGGVGAGAAHGATPAAGRRSTMPPAAPGASAAPPPPPMLTEQSARDAAEARFLPSPDDDRRLDDLTSHLLAAMISAARADNVLDADEQQRIHAQLAEAELPPEDKAKLLDLMRQPADPEGIARLAGSPEEAAELYLASALAIEPDHWAEQAYLRTLRDALGLDEGLARELEATAAQQRSGGP